MFARLPVIYIPIFDTHFPCLQNEGNDLISKAFFVKIENNCFERVKCYINYMIYFFTF